jgi:bifunctional DNA-binding transcriptional regulator/antitoxin component of YhaV-PrlF toxin-antitoxin module
MIVIHTIGCLTKTWKVGGLIVVTLPEELVETQKIKENEFVEITVKKCRKDGFGILKGMAPFTVEDELKTLE